MPAAKLSGVTILLVAIAGATGVLARYGVASAFEGDAVAWAIAAINVAGSFLLGVVVALPADALSGQARTALGVGFLGGFTTFSTFSLQAFADLEGGEPLRALAYVALSVLAGIGAAALGVVVTRAVA